MNRAARNIVVIVLALAGIGSLFLRVVLSRAAAAGEDAPATEPASEDQGAARVRTVAAREGEMAEEITAYGDVSAQPGYPILFSVPFECQVTHVRVAGGQQVDKGEALLDVEPSADAKLQIAEARNAVAAATKDLAEARQRFEMKLATNQELLQSEQNAQSAQLRLNRLLQRGGGEESNSVNASEAGIVGKLNVQEGQLVPAGSPLVDFVPRGRIEVRLGFQQSDLSRLHAGDAVRLFLPAGTEEGVPGRLRLISRWMNPDTRLIDVYASPAPDDKASQFLLLGSFARGVLTTAPKHGIIVPRTAVLPDDGGYILFTVKGGHAVKHLVTVDLRNDKDVEVSGGGLRAGEAVVVLGNLELEDGMAVAAEGGS